MPTPTASLHDALPIYLARHQPVKLAAAEALFRTQQGAPLSLGGWPDVARRENRFALEIPRESGAPCCVRNSASAAARDRKSTRLNSSHMSISYAVFCL